MAILHARRENVHVQFPLWGLCDLANQAIFLCNQDVHACTTGYKNGLSVLRMLLKNSSIAW